MDKIALETFLKVANEESFSRAAEQLHLSQPAISKRIALLEDELGSTLFDRIGKQVRLTHSGDILIQRAPMLLKIMQDCKTDIQNLNNNIEGTLKIGVSHHIGLHRFPPYLKFFSQSHPKLQLNIHFIDSEQAAPKLLNGELDIALVTLSQSPHQELFQEPLWSDPLSFVVCDNHALVKLNQERPLLLSDLIHHPAILPGASTYTGKLIEALFSEHQQTLNTYIETNYLETIKMMVSIGMGWAILPRTMIDKNLRGLQITLPNIHRQLGYMTHPARSLPNAAHALIKTLKSSLPNIQY